MNENHRAHAQNTTAAFFMAGLYNAGFDNCLLTWGNGCIELISELVSHVPYAAKLSEQYGDSHPGVFDYEVSQPFGAWFGKDIIDCYRAPSKTECEAWLSHAIAEFFSNGRSLGRDSLAEGAFEAYNFSEGVTVVTAMSGWCIDDENDYIKIVYVEYSDDPINADSHKVSFHVRFNSDGQIEDVYALETAHGNEIGRRGDIAA